MKQIICLVSAPFPANTSDSCIAGKQEPEDSDYPLVFPHLLFIANCHDTGARFDLFRVTHHTNWDFEDSGYNRSEEKLTVSNCDQSAVSWFDGGAFNFISRFTVVLAPNTNESAL